MITIHSNFRVIALLPKVLLLEWEEQPSEKLLEFLLSYKAVIEKQIKVTRCVMGYQSLMVHLLEDIEKLDWWKQHLNKLLIKTKKQKQRKGKHWNIPVCYDLDHAPDLATLANAVQKSVEEVIALHTQKPYRIYFLGFLPGFLYLCGLDKQLHFPRKEKPLLEVPKGSIGIGGMQTGIYPNSSPGGWHLIGRTPLSLFDAKLQPPCFAAPGDWISFKSIDSKTFEIIDEQSNQGTYQIKPYD